MGFTASSDGTSVSVASLDIQEPMALYNVDPSQMWCLNTCDQPCECTPSGVRGHVQATGPAGTIVNKKTCKYLKSTDPYLESSGEAGNQITTKDGTLSLVKVNYYSFEYHLKCQILGSLRSNQFPVRSRSKH